MYRPLSPFFHPLTLPGYLIFCCLFSEKLKNGDKKEGGRIIELFIGCLTWPNLACFSKPFGFFFYHLTPPVGGSQRIFERTVFERTTYPAPIYPILSRVQNFSNNFSNFFYYQLSSSFAREIKSDLVSVVATNTSGLRSELENPVCVSVILFKLKLCIHQDLN